MPRIEDPKKYNKTALDKDIAKVEKEIKLEKSEKALKGNSKKKEPNWTLLYVIVAILFFGLGLLVICTMNFFIHGNFGF